MPSPDQRRALVIFAGAGASKAVSPEDYPTTQEFFDRLPSKVTSNRLFKGLLSFLRRDDKSGEQIIDIEMILWRLRELRLFLQQTSDQKTTPGWFLQGHRLPQILGLQDANYGQLAVIVQKALHLVDDLESDINLQVYELYSKEPDLAKLHGTWLPLLDELDLDGFIIDIFTTNYDVVLEAAIRQHNGSSNHHRIDIGWTDTIERRLNLELWTSANRPNEPTGILTKLHGSANWVRRGDQILVGPVMYLGSHKRHAIIYPGFKGKPTDTVFQAFHDHLGRALQMATGVIFIGFAFRDEYINEICERKLSRKTPVVVINPDETLRLPFRTEKSGHVRGPFDEGTGHQAAIRLIQFVNP